MYLLLVFVSYFMYVNIVCVFLFVIVSFVIVNQ
eukprot:UN22155